MDDSWGNIIYLLLMALFIAVGALKKKKPPVPVKPPDDGGVEQESAPETRFDTVLDTLLGNQVSKPYVQHVETVVPEPEETLVEEYPDVREMSIEYDMKPKPKPSLFDDLKDTFDEREEDEKLELNDVDWQKAIIYKEILERRHF